MRVLTDIIDAVAVESHIGLWSLDPATGTLHCSPEMHDVLGVDATTCDAWLAHVHVDERERLAAALSAGEAFDLHHRIVRADGASQGVYVRARRIGEQLVGTFEAVEFVLQRALVDRIVSVSRFAASLAHELNNPLAVAVANLEMIAEQIAGDANLDEMAADAREALNRMRIIIRGLKTFTRAEIAGVEPVDVQRVLESAISVTNHEILRRARIVRDFQPLPAVGGLEAPLGHVFVNLLVNAAHAIPAGAIDRHEIRIATRMAPGPRVAVEIHDTGSGIPRENQARIFEPFFTTKPIGQGVGLGLAVCRNLVQAFGGDITFESAPTGTVFRVSLPIAKRSAPAVTPSLLPTTAGSRVLVVDDEVLITNALRRMLAIDYRLTIVNSAEAAAELFAAGTRFDAVVCDLMMPGIGGVGLYEEVRRVDAAQALRFIFLTGGASTPAAQRFLEQLSNPCLEKPCDFKQLRAAIDRIASEMHRE